MLVKLNAFRAGARPGDVVDVPDGDGATLIAHGAAFPADDVDAKPDTEPGTGRTVQAEASLQAASGTDTAETPDL